MNIQTVTYNGLSFVNVINPGQIEIKYLKNNFNFSTLDLEDYINKTQIPKVEVFKNYSLIVLDFPRYNPNSQSSSDTGNKTLLSRLSNLATPSISVPLSPFISTEKKKRIIIGQVDFFIGKDYVVVVHEGTLPTINDIFSLCQKTLSNRSKYMGDGPVFLAYRIIDALVDTCFPVINEISANIDKIDRELENSKSENTLESISVTRRNIVVFQTMIKPSIPLFRQLEDGKYKELNGSMQPFWSNILDHLQKIWDRLDDNRELLEGISVSHESFLTSRTNEIVKVLTIFSTIILPLTLLASIYGMNIEGLPTARQGYSFLFLIGLMAAIAIGLLLVFKQKRWF